ncbi:hypothetical protein [Bacillus manliponensis]|uniref:hypothetical protein n=1 Tax=Bacillus manliponensis TaxID=574376 RepID=UPI000B0271C2|nr:hypothetical protein [Bacillus manliponensis]
MKQPKKPKLPKLPKNYTTFDENNLNEALPFKNINKYYSININVYNINNTATDGSQAGCIEQRAEGGGQINENVGVNANQGGHNAINGSESFNVKSQFANGNGRSGIAGKCNDKQGGQEAIKTRRGGCDKNT